jgi:hypothetical protein
VVSETILGRFGGDGVDTGPRHGRAGQSVSGGSGPTGKMTGMIRTSQGVAGPWKVGSRRRVAAVPVEEMVAEVQRDQHLSQEQAAKLNPGPGLSQC